MDFLSTTEFRSKLHPEVKVTIRVMTVGRRIDFLRNWHAADNAAEVLEEAGRLWNALIKDFEGVTVDGVKPSIEDFYLNGPEDLVQEIRNELIGMAQQLDKTDDDDEAAIASAQQQITEAEARIAARKNSGPQSSMSGTQTAASVAEVQMTPAGSGSDEIAMAVPI